MRLFKIQMLWASPSNTTELSGKRLRCSRSRTVRPVFLPVGEKLSNYSLVITATAKSAGFLANTMMTAQVSVAVLAKCEEL